MNDEQEPTVALPRPDDNAEQTLSDPGAFLHALGHLHDCEVLVLEVNTTKQQVTLVVDDLYSNFLDLPEYPGKQPVRLIFSDVDDVDTGLGLDSLPARIMDLEVEAHSGSRTSVVVRLQPSGHIRIKCGAIACRTTGLRPKD
jgi:hypothetical protein